MHVSILALGSQGDVQPLAVLGKGLRAAGHEVCLATSENFADLVRAHGLDFAPIMGDSQAIVRQAGANLLALLRGFWTMAQEYSARIPEPIRTADVIVNQLPLALAGYDLAEKFGVPMLVAAVIPLFPTAAFPLMGLPALPLPGYNRLTYALAQQGGWQMARPMINRWRRQALDLPPLPLRGYLSQMGTARYPVVNGFSPHVVPRPPDWGEHVHVTGYWFPDEDGAWQPPDDLRAFIEGGSPPVFVGFGSMPVRNPRRTTELIQDALRRSGRRGILHAGWAGLGEGALSKDVFVIRYAPYGWLFPRMAMVIHHGGSGTTAFALRAGVPSLVVPFTFDQPYWGGRTAELGVGPRPIPFRRLSAARLAAAIAEGTQDAGMQARAAALGRRIAAEEGMRAAIDVIEGMGI